MEEPEEQFKRQHEPGKGFTTARTVIPNFLPWKMMQKHRYKITNNLHSRAPFSSFWDGEAGRDMHRGSCRGWGVSVWVAGAVQVRGGWFPPAPEGSAVTPQCSHLWCLGGTSLRKWEMLPGHEESLLPYALSLLFYPLLCPVNRWHNPLCSILSSFSSWAATLSHEGRDSFPLHNETRSPHVSWPDLPVQNQEYLNIICISF